MIEIDSQMNRWIDRYEVYKDHHVMTCIGNKVNLHLFLTILTMLRKS